MAGTVGETGKRIKKKKKKRPAALSPKGDTGEFE
jgi:hypothetical protein